MAALYAQGANGVILLFCAFFVCFQRLANSNGGEGGIRTPDRLTPMSDFESGAFNRALPPLRICFNDLRNLFIVPYQDRDSKRDFLKFGPRS